MTNGTRIVAKVDISSEGGEPIFALEGEEGKIAYTYGDAIFVDWDNGNSSPVFEHEIEEVKK